ncbi:hypothetical protein ROZALSC1DRAFT_22802 [Rozella allomycis CSF55]|uniref:Uncharacterized protein n=1 Tax=Rozella allomycis (strain CSF55) TaxID=988480 RepID=A0A4V1IZQ5_ROZAC|nr:hypothetical protein ROZALSC1DRAFT_22802 [Rozella allomycis CSF55]
MAYKPPKTNRPQSASKPTKAEKETTRPCNDYVKVLTHPYGRPNQKRDLMRAVGSVPQNELEEIQTKKIEHSLNFNFSVTSTIMKSVKFTVQHPHYVDCSHTSIKAERDISMIVIRELEISLKENSKNSAMAINKLKRKNQKQIYQIYLVNSYQSKPNFRDLETNEMLSTIVTDNLAQYLYALCFRTLVIETLRIFRDTIAAKQWR